MKESDLQQIKNYLFILGGVFAAVIGMYFSKTGFGFEIQDMEWVGYGLGILCFIVQVAFSSQLAYKSYNWVIFLCGILAYAYSGWSNYAGIMGLNPKANWMFAAVLGEFLDWIAEPLIVLGLVGVTDNADGDFLRNLFGRKAGASKQQQGQPKYTSSFTQQKQQPQPQYRNQPPKLPQPQRPQQHKINRPAFQVNNYKTGGDE